MENSSLKTLKRDDHCEFWNELYYLLFGKLSNLV